jgi:dissimilatory sulfite reductase (desulfoviridin) alpha/beta subunit
MRIKEDAAITTVDQNKTVCTVPAEEVARVKGLGCLWDKRTEDRFNMRVITVNGKLTGEKLSAIAEGAKRFGSGEAAMTSRLTIEIQGIPYENIEPLRAFLAQHGLESGGTGPKVRPVVSCKGTSCQYGLIDTFGLSEKIHTLFYQGYHHVKLPHKFKIAVGGCPNNCVKPSLNDLGIVGQRVPVVDMDKCRGCKSCQLEKACPMHIAQVQDGKIAIDPQTCIHCGRCVGKCPFHVTDTYINGYRVYLGGRWGKKFAHGIPMDTLFTTEEEVLSVVEKAILLFRDQGVAGERFADTVARIGFDTACAMLETDDLLMRKEEILSK